MKQIILGVMGSSVLTACILNLLEEPQGWADVGKIFLITVGSAAVLLVVGFAILIETGNLVYYVMKRRKN